MLDIAELMDDAWGWWEDVVSFWSTAKLVKMLFKWNIDSWFIDEIPDTI